MALAEGDVACVLAEPALTNIGIVLPAPGYHEALRRLTRETGTLLVIDETHTICAGPGGCTRAWELEPDAVVVGKTIGGGVPAAAYGLSADAFRAGALTAEATTRPTISASTASAIGAAEGAVVGRGVMPPTVRPPLRTPRCGGPRRRRRGAGTGAPCCGRA